MRADGLVVVGALGLVAFAVALVRIVRLGGELFAYAPAGQLELAFAAATIVPRVHARVRARLAAELPASRPRRYACRVVAAWMQSAAALLGLVPGLCFADSRGAVLATVVVVGAGYGALRALANPGFALRATWLALSLFAIIPTIAQAVFRVVV
jgi:hypothetical protein